MIVINLLALGTPMILMGDEIRRTQLGNNNAYCQDNLISWMDWSLVDKNADLLRFVQKMIRFRFGLNFYKEAHHLPLGDFLHQASIEWHGKKLNQPNWSQESRELAFLVRGRNRQGFVILNANWKALSFELPPAPNGDNRGWRRIIDTYRASPDDICDPGEAPLVRTRSYKVQPRSIVMLLSEKA